MQSPVKIWRNQSYLTRMRGKVGEIISWTVVRVPPAGFSSLAPYPVVLVDFGDHARISAQLVDWTPEDLAFGRKVQVVVRKVAEPTNEGVIPYGIKVKPL